MPRTVPEKLTASMWPKPRDSSVTYEIDVDARPIQALVEAAEKLGHRVTPTAIVSKAACQVLVDYPDLNRDVRGWRLRDRKEVDAWVTMTDGDGRLLGRRVDQMDTRGLVEVQAEITEHGTAHKEGRSWTGKIAHGIVKWTPLPLLRGIVRALEFILHTLRVPIGLLGLNREGAGAIHVTNVGPFGVKHVAAPIPPVLANPYLVAVGQIHEKPVLEDGAVVPGRVIPLTVTADHRVLVGINAAKWARRFEALLTDTEWMISKMPEEDREDIRAAMDAILPEGYEPYSG